MVAKKMYCLNNTVVVDHRGLFIFLDIGHPGSFHDINILRTTDLFQNWRNYFRHTDDYHEYLLGDPGYVGADAFIMRRFGRTEDTQGLTAATVRAWNKMHAGYRIKVEWGIGGLKRKWRRLMKGYDMRRYKFKELFQAAALLTNFLQRRRLDFSEDVEGERIGNNYEFGWCGDYVREFENYRRAEQQ